MHINDTPPIANLRQGVFPKTFFGGSGELRDELTYFLADDLGFRPERVFINIDGKRSQINPKGKSDLDLADSIVSSIHSLRARHGLLSSLVTVHLTFCEFKESDRANDLADLAHLEFKLPPKYPPTGMDGSQADSWDPPDICSSGPLRTRKAVGRRVRARDLAVSSSSFA